MNDQQPSTPVPAPLVTRCPICLSIMRPDGTHISLSSGAHIEAVTR